MKRLFAGCTPSRDALPDSFIFAAEKTGMINEIGKTVLKLACREAVSGLFRRDLRERLACSVRQQIIY